MIRKDIVVDLIINDIFIGTINADNYTYDKKEGQKLVIFEKENKQVFFAYYDKLIMDCTDDKIFTDYYTLSITRST